MTSLSDYKGVQIDPVLTNFAVGWKNDRFVSDQICPPIPVPKSDGIFNIWDKGAFRHVETARHDGADFNVIDVDFTTDTYSTKSHGLAATVTKKAEANASNPYQPRRAKVNRIMDLLALDEEIRMHTLVNAATSFNTGHTATLTSGHRWDEWTSSDSDPESDILTGCETIYNATYKEADSIIIPYVYARRLAKHPKVVKLREVQGDRLVNLAGLPNPLFGLNVIMPGAGYITTKKGQTVALGALWSDVCIIFHKGDPMSNEDATWLACFQWGNLEVEINYDFSKKANLITVEKPERSEQLISNLLAYKISNISA